MASATHRPDVDLGILLVFALRSLSDEMRRRVEDEGFGNLRPAHGFVFQTVHPDGATITELADRAQISKQAMGRMIDEIADNGYVVRRDDATDRRQKIVVLTDKGRDAFATVITTWKLIEDEWRGRLGDAEMVRVRHALEQIVDEYGGWDPAGRRRSRPMW